MAGGRWHEVSCGRKEVRGRWCEVGRWYCCPRGISRGCPFVVFAVVLLMFSPLSFGGFPVLLLLFPRSPFVVSPLSFCCFLCICPFVGSAVVLLLFLPCLGGGDTQLCVTTPPPLNSGSFRELVSGLGFRTTGDKSERPEAGSSRRPHGRGSSTATTQAAIG